MNDISSKNFAVVTGASMGLGKSLALELAKRGNPLILVSLPDENLKTTCQEIRLYGVEAIHYTLDLTDKIQLQELARWITENFEINLLINNAGIGGFGGFANADPDRLDAMIQVNIRAVTLLTRLLLPKLLNQPQAFVLNISSLAAFSPIAYKTVYPATKSFIYNFTMSLHEEYKDSPVHFSVVSPGPIDTNGIVSQQIVKNDFGAKMLLMDPDEVARITIKKLFQKKKIIRLNPAHHVGLFLLWLVPEWLTIKILSKKAKKEAG